MRVEAVNPLDMLSPHHHHLTVLHLVLLLGTADGAQNVSEAASSSWMASLPSRRDIVVKEGSSTLIECNVTGHHNDIKWYNSEGILLADGAGRRSVRV